MANLVVQPGLGPTQHFDNPANAAAVNPELLRHRCRLAWYVKRLRNRYMLVTSTAYKDASKRELARFLATSPTDERDLLPFPWHVAGCREPQTAKSLYIGQDQRILRLSAQHKAPRFMFGDAKCAPTTLDVRIKVALHHPFHHESELLELDGREFTSWADTYGHCRVCHIQPHDRYGRDVDDTPEDLLEYI
ncbi:hypothetical protein N7497_003020 [Penicillium chrysogenum]|uniref:HNH nuclease domain-containing protein n=1 Tax=Penicillium chrysogenum TaxID=5076 RepID=A0ABQ8W1K6_PENCH|nr:hypothetical protein N7505_011809 [Penicillium chrysogenum]KAJ5268200.1 hypothetical protein N7524_005659 [Penicillium chrysogenum]KAJ6163041.1 hypothetical protein N7497_003020 [Penicillium chrysogenum]